MSKIPEDGSVKAFPSQSTPPLRGILKIAGFFALIGGLAWGLDGAITHGLRGVKTSKFGALNHIMFGDINAEIVIIGSSRALAHYDPRVIQRLTGLSAFNLGRNAAQIDWQSVIFKSYLKHNAKPKILIQNLDLSSFESTKNGNIYDPGYYLPYLCDKQIYDGLRKLEPEVWKWKYIPLYGYSVVDMRFTWITGILGCLGIQSREDYFSGFNPRNVIWNEDFLRFKRSHPEGIGWAIESKGVNAFEENVQMCQNQGIKLFFIFSPEYVDIQAIETNRAEIFGKFNDVSHRFDVQLWDYSDSDISQHQEYFENSQHLNAKGASVFSTSVAERLARFLAEERGGASARSW